PPHLRPGGDPGAWHRPPPGARADVLRELPPPRLSLPDRRPGAARNGARGRRPAGTRVRAPPLRSRRARNGDQCVRGRDPDPRRTARGLDPRGPPPAGRRGARRPRCRSRPLMATLTVIWWRDI